MLAFHPWANVGGRIPAEICMRICLRFYVRVLSPRVSPFPFLFQPSFFVTGTIDETAIERILFSPSKGRSADRVVQGGGWRYKYLFVGIRRI